MSPDARMARLLAEMDRADAELRIAADSLRAQDGLLDPALEPVLGRLGRRFARGRRGEDADEDAGERGR